MMMPTTHHLSITPTNCYLLIPPKKTEFTKNVARKERETIYDFAKLETWGISTAFLGIAIFKRVSSYFPAAIIFGFFCENFDFQEDADAPKTYSQK